MLRRRHPLLVLVIIAAASVTACSRSTSQAPTAPTASPSASTVSIDLNTPTAAGTPGAGFNAPVVGTVSGFTGTCPEVKFVLAGVTIHTTSATTFEGGACADIQNGVRAGAIGDKRPDGSITAKRVKIAPPPPPSVSGQVTGLTGNCPNLTFSLSGTVVHTTDKTVFEGGACGDVREGGRAGAVGSKGADGSITAERVKIAPPPLPAAFGPVTGLTGNCPNLTFSLSGTVVHTTDRTFFDGGACGDVKEGVRAGAAGPKGSDGSITAEHVKIATPPPPGTTRIAGTVASTSGSCPGLTFVVTTPVATTSAQTQVTVRITDKTRFERGACGDIKAGAHVGASGLKAAGGSIDAVVVVVDPAR